MKEIMVGAPLRAGDRVIVPLIKEAGFSGMGGVYYAARPVALIIAEEECMLFFSLDSDVPLSDEIIHDAAGQARAVLEED
ncbi:MAG: hypothetical protein PHQ81_03735 [Methanofollis sp.]|nr:hypothetical protein [Methanofollis sp.]